MFSKGVFDEVEGKQKAVLRWLSLTKEPQPFVSLERRQIATSNTVADSARTTTVGVCHPEIAHVEESWKSSTVCLEPMITKIVENQASPPEEHRNDAILKNNYFYLCSGYWCVSSGFSKAYSNWSGNNLGFSLFARLLADYRRSSGWFAQQHPFVVHPLCWSLVFQQF